MSVRPDARQYLAALEQFRAQLKEPDTKEAAWQKLFADCPFILSESLPLRVLPSQIVPLARPGVREADFAIVPALDDPLGMPALVELKRPGTRIFTSDRHGILKLSAATSGAVSQIQVYGSQFKWTTRTLGFGTNRYLFVIVGLMLHECAQIGEEIVRMQLAHLLPPNLALFGFDQILAAFEAQLRKRGAFPLLIVLRGNNFPVPSWAETAGRDSYGQWAEFVVKSVPQRMRWIPPGEFLMGSPESEIRRDPDEGPQHGATLSEGFWLADTPCTAELWRSVMLDLPGGRRPFCNRTLSQAYDFLGKLNQLRAELNVRLPSEAEWEYACRAGTSSRYWFGESEQQLTSVAWIRDNSERDVHPVREKRPNPWGLYDVYGNVWELCADSWHDSYHGAPRDGSPWRGGSTKLVTRGGSYLDTANLARSACRSWYVEGGPVVEPNSGLRLARSG